MNTLVRSRAFRAAFVGLLCTFFAFAASEKCTAQDMTQITSDLQSNDWEVRLSAVERLSKGTDEKAVDILMSVADTDNEYWPVKIRAMETLGKIGNPKCVEVLLKLFTNTLLHVECPSIKSYAAAALGSFKERRVVAVLVTAVNDKEVLTREAVVQALGKIGDPKAVPYLIRALNDSSFAVRLSATRALGMIGDPQAVPALKKVAEGDDDPIIKSEAQSALRSIKG